MKRLVLAVSVLLGISTPSAAQTVFNDLSGLGEGALATTLSRSIFLSEITTNRAVEGLVNRDTQLGIQEKKRLLEHLGFKCLGAEPIECAYSGVAKSTFVDEAGGRSTNITNVTLNAVVAIEKIKVNSRIRRSSEKGIQQ